MAGILVGWFLVLGRDFGWVGFDWFLGRCGFVGVAYNKKNKMLGCRWVRLFLVRLVPFEGPAWEVSISLWNFSPRSKKCREQRVPVIRLLCSPYSIGRLRLSVSGFFS